MRVSFNAAQQAQSWEDWCALTFKGDPGLISKCNSKPGSICPIGICFPWATPWSELGAKERGIPHGDALAELKGQRFQVTQQRNQIMIAAANEQQMLQDAASDQTFYWLASAAGVLGIGLLLFSRRK